MKQAGLKWLSLMAFSIFTTIEYTQQLFLHVQSGGGTLFGIHLQASSHYIAQFLGNIDHVF
jgi:hypothetical protein